MGFLYPRTIAVSRPNIDSAVGAQPYGGLAASNETVIVSGVSASIQLERLGKPPSAGLPGDADGRGTWRILFKQPLGTVLERDIITDDLGVRYQVTNAYWDSMSYAVLAERLQT